jgi:membrane-associated phospholipid phosphatase
MNLQQLNEDLFYYINSFQGNGYDKLMLAASSITSRWDFGYYLLVFIFFAFLHTQYTKQKHPRNMMYVLTLWGQVIGVFVVSYLINLGLIEFLKLYLAVERPFAVLPEGSVRTIGIEMPLSENNKSFPSGHASMAALVIASAWPLISGFGKVIAVGFVALACWSRVALGVHWPFDVITGALIATAITIMVRRITNKYIIRNNY